MIPVREAPVEWVSFFSPDQAIEIRCTEGEAEDFDADLPELAVATALRSFAPELRPNVEELLQVACVA